MSIKLGVADTTVSYLKPRIAVIGVGGGGGNAVNNMIAQNLEGVDFIVANTDAQALAHSSASCKIQLGLEITQGLGAGARPEIGKMAAEEAKDKIAEALEGVNMVFITAGMGGGTGSGAAPVVAHIAKEKGILTVGVVTKPFSFEGRKRMEIAEASLANFTNEVDSIIVIPNQNLFRVADENTTLADAFIMADDVLYSGVRSITDLMMMPGLINLDFADVKNIMEDKGKAIMGTGEAEGKGRAKEAARQALANPLLDDCSMQGAKGVLINITGGTDITLPELDEAASTIKEEVGEDANIIFGSSFDESLAGKIRVSIVVTGINDGLQQPIIRSRIPEPSIIDIEYGTSGTEVPIINLDNDEPIEPVLLDDEVDNTFTIPEPEISEEENVIEEVKEDFEEDFEGLDKSDELPEVPRASALFNSIINNTGKKDTEQDEFEFTSITNNEEEFFKSDITLQDLPLKEDVTDLFNDTNDPTIFKGEEEVVEEPVIEGTEKDGWFDRILGIKSRKKSKEENAVEDFSLEMPQDEEVNTELSADELDIPAFLRRK